MSVIGIDLGTTFSCVAVWQHEAVNVIANEQGKRTTHSYVAFDERERLLGFLAKNQLTKKPTRTVFGVKRLIGRRFSDATVQDDIKLWPFAVVDVADKPMIEVQYKTAKKSFTAEEISAMMLLKMKQIAETLVGDVKDAVIAVPASFTDVQRQATIDAGTVAGLNVLRIINESTAAALAFGLGKSLPGKQNILIFDLGGGNFDVSIVDIDDGSKFTVISTAGDPHLGGEDFDDLLVRHFADEFRSKTSIDVNSSLRAVQRLRVAAEVAKRTLSSLPTASIEVDALVDGIDFYTTVTRESFEDLCFTKFNKTMDCVTKVLETAKMTKDDINHVVLVGGSTRIPKIQSLLQNMFDGKELNMTVNLDEAVAIGAAVQGAMLSEAKSAYISQLIISDVTSEYSLSRCDSTHNVIIDRYSHIPCNKNSYFNEYFEMEVFERGHDNSNRIGKFVRCDSEVALGDRQIHLECSVNINGILEAKVFEQNTDPRKEIAHYVTESLSRERVRELTREAAGQLDADRDEQERVNARHELEKYTYSILHALNKCDPSKRDGDWEQLKRDSTSTLSWIEEKEERTKEDFTSRLRGLQEHWQWFERKKKEKEEEEKRLMLELEKQRSKALEQLERYVIEAQFAMTEVHDKYRNSDCAEFMKLCEDTLSWIDNNQEEIRDVFEGKLQVMQREHQATTTSLREYEEQLLIQEKEEKERRRVLEQQRMEACDQLDKCVIEVQFEMSQVDENLRNFDWEKLNLLCTDTLTWIDNNQAATNAEFNEELSNVQRQYEVTKASWKKHDEQLVRMKEEEAEKQRILAREQLEQYIAEKQNVMNLVDEHIRNLEWKNFVQQCTTTTIWLANNQGASKDVFDDQLATMQQNYEATSSILQQRQTEFRRKLQEKKLKEDLETQRIAARNQLQEYVDEVKSDMLKQGNLSPGKPDWDSFVTECDVTLTWLRNNQMASKNTFEERLQHLKQEYEVAKANLKDHQLHLLRIKEEEMKNRKIEESEEQRVAARNSLEEYIQGVNVVLNTVDVQYRHSDWNSCSKLCDDTLNWLENNQGSTKDVFDKHLDIMKRQNAATTKSLQEYQDQLAKMKENEGLEQQRIAARAKLQKYVDDVHNTNQQVDVHLRNSDWEEFSKLCEETINWIRINQGADKVAFEEKNNHIKRQCDSVEARRQEHRSQLNAQIENDEKKRIEESEQQRLAARSQLEKYVNEVRSAMFQPMYSQLHNPDKEQFVTDCKETLQWLRSNHWESKECFDKKLGFMRQRFDSTVAKLVEQKARLHQVQQDEEKKRKIEELEQQRIAAKDKLEKYVLAVTYEMHQVPLPSRNLEWTKFDKLCAETQTWIRNHQDAESYVFEEEYNHMKCQYDATTASLRNHQIHLNEVQTQNQKKQMEELQEKQRIAARNQLENYVAEVRGDTLKKDYSQLDNSDQQKFINDCDETLNWLRYYHWESREIYEKQIALIQQRYVSTTARFEQQKAELDQMQRNEEKKRMIEELDQQRIAAKDQLEKYVVGVKSEIRHVPKQLRNSDWQKFEELCEKTLNWIHNHQDAGREVFEQKYDHMKRQYEATTESLQDHQAYLRNLQKDEEKKRMEELEYKRIAARNDLRQYVITIKTAMDQVNDRYRNSAWDECVETCNKTWEWLNKNQEADKDALEELLNILQRQHEVTTTSLLEYQALLLRKNEEEEEKKKMKKLQLKELEKQRIAARNDLRQCVITIKSEMDQVKDRYRTSTWDECVQTCKSTWDWLSKNQEADKDTFEEMLNNLQRQHEATRLSLLEYQALLLRMKTEDKKKLQLKELEKQRIAARDRLEKCVNEVKSHIKQPEYSKRRNLDWQECVDLCDNISKWLESNQNASKDMYERQQNTIQLQFEKTTASLKVYQRMKEDEQKKRQREALETERIAARNRLKRYVNNAKTIMQQPAFSELHNTDWHEFIQVCDEELAWLSNNQSETKEKFVDHLDVVERTYNTTVAKLMIQKDQIEEVKKKEENTRKKNELAQERIAAREKLQDCVFAARTSMAQIKTEKRNSDWHTFVKECNDKLIWIDTNPEASLDVLRRQIQNIQRRQAETEESLRNNGRCCIII